jgi:aspartyl-tRNA(Asn)/glutamyl-tRNA(Gln) amidotransferase subunit A
VLEPDILYRSVRELGELIRARKLSPVALTESYLERSLRLGPRFNAYANLTRERALLEAGRAEAEIRAGKIRGPLHGIPYAAKDLLAAKGAPTTWGARPFLAQRFDEDATVIRKLTEAGAILLGKAAMIELAGGLGYRFASASATGPAKNPWNEKCWTCGSSSGSAAIAGTGLAAFTIGSETWGSIVCPSAFCGLSGLRPTYGRVSRHGAMALSYSMDKIGVIARSADDCGIVLSAIAGHDPADPASLRDGAYRDFPEAPRPRRLGWIVNAWKKIHPSVAMAVTGMEGILRSSGAKEVRLPEGPWDDVGGVVISAEAATAFEGLIESGRVAELTDPLGKVAAYVAAETPASDYLRAIRLRGILQRRMESLFSEVDILAAPTLPVTATDLGVDLEKELDFPDPMGSIGNLCGLPAVSIPFGMSREGMPVGLELVGRPYADGEVLAAARWLQSQSDWHKKRPPI